MVLCHCLLWAVLDSGLVVLEKQQHLRLLTENIYHPRNSKCCSCSLCCKYRQSVRGFESLLLCCPGCENIHVAYNPHGYSQSNRSGTAASVLLFKFRKSRLTSKHSFLSKYWTTAIVAEKSFLILWHWPVCYASIILYPSTDVKSKNRRPSSFPFYLIHSPILLP